MENFVLFLLLIFVACSTGLADYSSHDLQIVLHVVPVTLLVRGYLTWLCPEYSDIHY